MTTTIEETGVDTESITLLDFEYAPECEYREISGTEDCDDPAEYKMVLSCCAEVWLCCEDHMLHLVNVIKTSFMAQHNPKWGGCGAYPIHFTLIERL